MSCFFKGFLFIIFFLMILFVFADQGRGEKLKIENFNFLFKLIFQTKFKEFSF